MLWAPYAVFVREVDRYANNQPDTIISIREQEA